MKCPFGDVYVSRLMMERALAPEFCIGRISLGASSGPGRFHVHAVMQMAGHVCQRAMEQILAFPRPALERFVPAVFFNRTNILGLCKLAQQGRDSCCARPVQRFLFQLDHGGCTGARPLQLSASGKGGCPSACRQDAPVVQTAAQPFMWVRGGADWWAQPADRLAELCENRCE